MNCSLRHCKIASFRLSFQGLGKRCCLCKWSKSWSLRFTWPPAYSFHSKIISQIWWEPSRRIWIRKTVEKIHYRDCFRFDMGWISQFPYLVGHLLCEIAESKSGLHHLLQSQQAYRPGNFSWFSNNREGTIVNFAEEFCEEEKLLPPTPTRIATVDHLQM